MNATLSFDYLRTSVTTPSTKPIPIPPPPPTADELAEREARRRKKRNAGFERLRQTKAAAIVRDRLIRDLMNKDRVCPCCGVTMNSDGLLRHRPRLVGDIGQPSLLCWECFARIKADCEQRSHDTGGLLPLPVVDAENDCEVSP
ncbi:MAG: hypothetical protein SH850_08065 [Planctomycetaceae bacterium]|nr:hypothetical protein [Planctomycetaceae bacterium]